MLHLSGITADGFLFLELTDTYTVQLYQQDDIAIL